ncbi:hypothetical protein HK102_010379, partial [Quaeritorhiza haematococci]
MVRLGLFESRFEFQFTCPTNTFITSMSWPNLDLDPDIFCGTTSFPNIYPSYPNPETKTKTQTQQQSFPNGIHEIAIQFSTRGIGSISLNAQSPFGGPDPKLWLNASCPEGSVINSLSITSGGVGLAGRCGPRFVEPRGVWLEEA